jgi:hypothetical protein
VERGPKLSSYARGDWVEDLPNAYFSDFDLMVVVGTQALADDETLWASVLEKARPIAGRAPVTLIVHDVKQMDREIRWGQYFYADVVNEGILLFDSRRFTLATPKALNAKEWLELGQHNFAARVIRDHSARRSSHAGSSSVREVANRP